jgi:hypothetical protein
MNLSLKYYLILLLAINLYANESIEIKNIEKKCESALMTNIIDYHKCLNWKLLNSHEINKLLNNSSKLVADNGDYYQIQPIKEVWMNANIIKNNQKLNLKINGFGFYYLDNEAYFPNDNSSNLFISTLEDDIASTNEIEKKLKETKKDLKNLNGKYFFYSDDKILTIELKNNHLYLKDNQNKKCEIDYFEQKVKNAYYFYRDDMSIDAKNIKCFKNYANFFPSHKSDNFLFKVIENNNSLIQDSQINLVLYNFSPDDTLNIRNQPSTKGMVIGTKELGSQELFTLKSFLQKAKSSNWLQIILYDKNLEQYKLGWINKQYAKTMR